MTLLVLGLILFLGTHALTMARGTRAGLIERFGANGYKAIYSVLSLAGFVLLVWGFQRYRAGGYIELWTPPRWMPHLTLLLMFPAMIALSAYILPVGRLKVMLRHPMLVAIKIWALAHLLTNGDLGSMLLFGAFLAYAVVDRISMKRRGEAKPDLPAWGEHDTFSIGLGMVLYVAFIYVLHPLLIGVPVLPVG